VQPSDRVGLLGLTFDRLTTSAVVARCMEWCAAERAPHVVVTANASHICMIRQDPELRVACAAGDIIVADGMSVIWAARSAGLPLPERVAGVDLMAELLRAGGERRLRAYFLGARPQVVSRLAALCQARYPGLVVAGYRDGYFSPDEHAGIAAEIRACAPHLLFIGMPSPFKETWCERYRQVLDVPVMVGVGGSFDVHAGFIRRAPRWVQRAGLEWAWRLLMEPRKLWKRYLLTNTQFAWMAGREILARRFHRTEAER
jgi:N-acetylglucosaminyldiphosphoundecaprenol N-acetyl-beta-D-mannosaminyltransferase